uniref:Uncharacterized protein n=1 Tax=Podoviridae sp. ct8Lf7 TaxID=2827723 RepID=A0A8S5S0V1_9CAUD|nr:MAG TPA: hypothetical protein [Podoviridae sp. ct8Lf7]
MVVNSIDMGAFFKVPRKFTNILLSFILVMPSKLFFTYSTYFYKTIP